MATIPKPRYVSVDDKQISITNFTTLDKDIHSYFANMSEYDASTEIKEISAILNEEIDKGFKEILDSLK